MGTDMDWNESRFSDDSPTRERRGGGGHERMDVDKSSSHITNKDKSRSRREEKDQRSRDRVKEKEGKELEKDRSRDTRRKEDRDERDKDKMRHEKDAGISNERDKSYKEKERDKDRRGKEKEKEREREVEKDKGKEKSSRDKDKDKDKERERERMKEKQKDWEREKGKEQRHREKEREVDHDKGRQKERDRGSRRQRDESKDDLGKSERSRDTNVRNNDAGKGKGSYDSEDDDARTSKIEEDVDKRALGSHHSASELEERISKMRDERLKNSEGASEVLSWVSRSRKLEEKRNFEKEKALQLSRIFEEQDNINEEESDEEQSIRNATQDLDGVKVLHGLDKVLEGGAVVLTLKDQSILAGGDINQEVDVLENVEIGEQKQRDEAYKAAKKKTGIYDDKFNDDPGSEKKILPQYDDAVTDEGVTLDATGRFSGEAEKKLEELRRRIQGASARNHGENLNSSGKILSDYYTQEEMVQFKKPKKKKSLRKKEKLDIDALEAEAISSGLGAEDLGSRRDGKKQALKAEQERSEAEMRSNAYQLAYAKANEASKALQYEQTLSIATEEEENSVFGDDDDDLRKSLERARKLALKKQDESGVSGLQVIANLATSSTNDLNLENNNSIPGESQEDKVVFTEMEEFVWGLQLDEEMEKPQGEDVFMEEDFAAKASDEEMKDEDGGWTEVKETENDETPADEKEEEIVPDETIHEVAVGKGLSGALKLLKDRGTLKETVEWGGRNMDKKKSKLVGIYENDGTKEIRIERTDEYGRILTPKEAFRLLSHKFHGKGPGKMKQEKRMRQYQEELKVKQMKNADTPSLSVERMREAQAKLKTPYLVLSGHVKPGQTSDPQSGFATVEKDLPGGLTPMLGDKKVEHFLGIKRKSESVETGSQKKPKP